LGISAEVFGFARPNWNISPEQPSGRRKDRERVDLQVEYFGIKRKFLVMISVEGKHGTGQALYNEVEVRAYYDCAEYMA
jgi:hypothetical protein